MVDQHVASTSPQATKRPGVHNPASQPPAKKSRTVPPNASLKQCKAEIAELFDMADAHHQPFKPMVEDVSEEEINKFIQLRACGFKPAFIPAPR